jgi:hypothetical protein
MDILVFMVAVNLPQNSRSSTLHPWTPPAPIRFKANVRARALDTPVGIRLPRDRLRQNSKPFLHAPSTGFHGEAYLDGHLPVPHLSLVDVAARFDHLKPAQILSSRRIIV